MEGGNSEKRRGWLRPALQQKKGQCVFFSSLIFSVFSYLLPQKFVEGVPKVMGHPSSIPDIRMENSKKPIYCILFEPNHLLGQLQIYKLATSIIKK